MGKTIEAGLVISQKWAERKRRMLVITPANLRKQWHQEMAEKFFLPCEILESKSYNAALKKGNFRPFETKEDAFVICSYQFAANKAADVHHKVLLTATPLQNSLLELFGLVSVIDEHTFGNVRSFLDQFSTLNAQTFGALKSRLKPVCHRTLRRQVTAYVPYTKRHAIVQPFDPG